MNYKLVYFDVRGRAEPIRMLLHHEGIPFEDVRFPGDQWPAYKPSKLYALDHKFQSFDRSLDSTCLEAPLGKAPWLEVDGRKLPETDAICRYLACKFGERSPANHSGFLGPG